MKQEHRNAISLLRQFMESYKQYIPYVHSKRLQEVFTDMGLVLYGILTDNKDNPYRGYDREELERALDRLRIELVEQDSIA